MKGQEKFDRFIQKHPHSHRFFFERPHVTRRDFFRWAGAGLTGSVLAGPLRAGEASKPLATPINKAKNTIFLLLSGAISHIDTFDFKRTQDTPLDVMKPETFSGIEFPAGIMPRLAENVPDMAIIRSARSWALQHNLAQTWTQIGRSPASALGEVAPNTGSVVALEYLSRRKPTDTFPTFLALNSGNAIGSGYLPSTHEPFRINPEANGLPDTNNADGQTRFNDKYAWLKQIDAHRTSSPNSPDLVDYDKFYNNARGLMFNPVVDQAFRFTTQESQRYGATGFGNACLTAGKVLAADQGTRYIQITLGGWDHHQNIYTALPPLARTLDNGLSALIADLKSSGQFNQTMIVMMGEFGRTVGRITGQQGRDHFLQQFILFAGAGIRGGRALGATDETGARSATMAWSRDRDVRPEDVEATIYSAMGIDWTTIRYDDPFGRGFEYVPYAREDVYGPIHELWS
ncbi:MAG: DUF1501 domain-containing protein [Acidimicrobiia bacterium]|nr:DUF1501 domain-containing protein [Acidimicrobiia bacterium]